MAPRSVVYQALIDPHAVEQWRVPDGMTCKVHFFDARENGLFRVSLTYSDQLATGKTAVNTDTYQGKFLELVPNVRITEQIKFETSDPELQAAFTITTELSDADNGTHLSVVFANLPHNIATSDNETGTRMSLAKLAALVERM